MQQRHLGPELLLVIVNDLTATEPWNHGVYRESIPKLAELFRFVKSFKKNLIWEMMGDVGHDGWGYQSYGYFWHVSGMMVPCLASNWDESQLLGTFSCADVVKVPNVCSQGDDFRIFGCSKTMLNLRELELSNHLWLALLKPQVRKGLLIFTIFYPTWAVWAVWLWMDDVGESDHPPLIFFTLTVSIINSFFFDRGFPMFDYRQGWVLVRLRGKCWTM